MTAETAALERVRILAEKWTALEGGSLGVALDKASGPSFLTRSPRTRARQGTGWNT